METKRDLRQLQSKNISDKFDLSKYVSFKVIRGDQTSAPKEKLNFVIESLGLIDD